TSRTPVGVPQTAIRIDCGAVRVRTHRRLCEDPPFSQSAFGLVQLENPDGASRRIGKIELSSIRTHAQTVRDSDILQVTADAVRAIERIQTSAQSGLIALDHRATPEAALSVYAAVVESHGRIGSLRARQPGYRSILRLVERKPTLEGGNQTLAAGHEA